MQSSLKDTILRYLIIFSIIPLLLGSGLILYQMYQSKTKSILYEHTRILNIAIQEADSIATHIEMLAQQLKKRYPRSKHTIIDTLAHIDQQISSIMILDNNGRLIDFVSKTNPHIYKGYDYSNKEFFLAIKDGKDRYWSKVNLAYDTNTPSISYTIRVSKDTIAVMVMDLDILNRFAKKFKSIDGEYMLRIASSDGVFMAHPTQPSFVEQRKNLLNSDLFRKFISKNMQYQQIHFDGLMGKNRIGVYGVTKKLKWYIIVVEQYDTLFKTFNELMFITVSLLLLLLILAIYFSMKLSTSILKPLDKLNQSIDDIAHGKHIQKIRDIEYVELERLSQNVIMMQNKILQREDQNRQKDKQIHDSAKMAQMGEMIGNIAHQWRQPLSVISTAASGMKIEKEFGILSDKKLYEYCDNITQSTQYLSTTIDTFRDFLKEKKEKKTVVLQDRIDKALAIIKSSMENNFIKIENKIDYSKQIYITMTIGELTQVIINIMNNAKDVLLERKVENPTIVLSSEFTKDKAIIMIEDNGGGIESNIIDKIFDPYFTTKHKSQGTGLGLHMSYKIVTESLKGKLYVKNSSKGAKFYIELPL